MKKFEKMKSEMASKTLTGMSMAQEAISNYDEEKKIKIKMNVLKTYNFMILFVMALTMVSTVFATDKDPAAEIIKSMIDVICKVFRYVGVVLGVYAIGQLVMAFKNEDADSKSKATTMLVIAGILVGIKELVEATNLKSYLDE